MLENFFQLVKIGKELGLSKKELNRVLLFNNTKNPILYKLLIIAAFIFVGFVIIILWIEASRHVYSPNIPPDNTYPSGILYSAVRIKDFNKRKMESTVSILKNMLLNLVLK